MNELDIVDRLSLHRTMGQYLTIDQLIFALNCDRAAAKIEIETLRIRANRHEAEIAVLRDELEKAKAVSVPANEFPHDKMDAIALHRFKVEQTDSNVWGWCVRAGDGTQELYKGRKSSCEAVARRLIGAFLDGAMLAHDMLAAAPQPQQADIVLDKICDVFQIGKFWHTESTILENVKNAARRSQCLSDIERKFFTTVYEDDEGDTVEDCALNWGDEPSEYVERFGEALRTLIEQQKQAASVPEGPKTNQVATKPNDKYTFVFPDASMTKIRYIFVDGEMVYKNLGSEQ